MPYGIDWLQKLPHGGKHTVTSAEASANAAVIDTGKPDASAYIVQVYRAGKVVTSDAAVSLSAGKLTVGDGTSFNLTEGDVICWCVF